ncbi:MAG: acyl-CoA dehydrogenase family protein, partial [Acidimicrobiia bacterium]
NLLANVDTDRPSGDEVDRVKAEVACGDAAITWVCTDAMGHWGTDVVAGAADTGYRLDGISGLVQDGHLVEWLLVRAQVDGAIGTFLVAADTPGVSITALEGLDLTRRWSRVLFNNVQVMSRSRLVEPGLDTIEDRHLQIAATLTVCETVGAIDQLFTSTVQYAKDRVAFGRPIGSFQAIKHLLADASVSLETSKAMAEAAVVAVGTEAADAAQVVSMAKSYVGDASLDVVNACWQTHGGIAYTWQHDFHLYLRRVATDAALYGDPTWHREQLCRVATS